MLHNPNTVSKDKWHKIYNKVQHGKPNQTLRNHQKSNGRFDKVLTLAENI